MDDTHPRQTRDGIRIYSSEDFAGICQDFVFEKADSPGVESTEGELPW